jgi:hypothetical protein
MEGYEPIKSFGEDTSQRGDELPAASFLPS